MKHKSIYLLILSMAFLTYQLKAQASDEGIEDHFLPELNTDSDSASHHYFLISFALNNSNAIGLSEENIKAINSAAEQLGKSEDAFKKAHPREKFISTSLQNKILNANMSDEQYCNFIIIKNKIKSSARAKRDWDELVSRNLKGNYDESKTIKEFTKFYICKAFAYGRYENNEKMRKKYLANLYGSEKGASVQLYFARLSDNEHSKDKKSSKSQLMFAVANSYKLGLQINQLTSLMNKMHELKRLKDSAFIADFEKKFDVVAYEKVALQNILSHDQYSALVTLTNTKAKKENYQDYLSGY